VVLAEARVFSGDNGVLKLPGDTGDGDRLVALGVALAGEPGLDAALDLDGSGEGRDPLENEQAEGERAVEYKRGGGQPEQNFPDQRTAD
jgi:hypothetical protein